MESIVVHPESEAQLKTVKAVLNALKGQFKPQSAMLPPQVSKSVAKSMAQNEQGQTISLAEFTERHFSKPRL